MQELFSQTENIKEILDYLNNPSINVCLLEGKAGSFKTRSINEAIKRQTEKTKEEELVFNLKCFESTTLDDIFLLFLDTIKNYAKKEKLAFSKVETNDISQRINHYLTHIKAPTIVIIDSLQNIFENHNEKDREEIIRFITHLATVKNYKLILVSNNFPESFAQEFKNKFIPLKRIEMKALSQQETKEYFERQNQTVNQQDIEMFYELSKGSPAALFITSYLLTLLNTNLTKLLEEYTTKQLVFGTYLIQKILTFVPDNVKYSLEALSVFNGGLTETFLINEELFTKEQIDYLLDKGLLVKEYGLIYVKSFVKNYLQKTVTNIVKNKFHLYWKEFYSSQLPLKPAQRAVLISRNTMRAQIEYHASHIIEQKKKASTPNLSLISYLNSDITSWNYQKTNTSEKSKTQDDNKEQDERKRELPVQPESIKNREKLKKGLEKYELTPKELALLGLPVDLNDRTQKQEKDEEIYLSRTAEQREVIEQKEEVKQENIPDTFSLALSMEEVHNYETAATFYLQALDMKTADDYEEYHAKILEHLALCCEKMNRTEDAMDFYNKLVDLYSQNNDTERVNKTKLNIAGVYRKTYKLNHARVIYDSFIKDKDNLSDEVLVLSYVGLADIEMSSSNPDLAMEYYQKAYDKEIDVNDAEIRDYLAQASFKYAMILDEYGQTEKAFRYYENCIETSNSKSSSVSGAYTNMAEIVKDKGDNQKALEYYQKALDIDTELSNYEGVYYIALQLAILYENSDKEQTLHWLLKSLNSAKKTNDTLYISNAYIETGDFYANTGSYEKSLKSYFNAQKSIENTDDSFEKQENIENIKYKISKVKNKINKDEYERIVKEVYENE